MYITPACRPLAWADSTIARLAIPPELGRKLDMGLNLLLYVGPILAGATLMDHLDSLEDFGDIGWSFLAAVPSRTEPHRATLSWLILGQRRPVHPGLPPWPMCNCGAVGISPRCKKSRSTRAPGAVSLYAWGFNSFGEAFFVMNFFHALQYFAIVWWE